MKLLRALANTWLLVFWADTALGLVDEVGALVVGIHLLAWVRSIMSAVTMLAMPLLWLGVGLGALPLRIFGPPLLYAAWVVLGAAPVSIWLLGTEWFGLALIAVQTAIATWLAWQVHRLHERKETPSGWLLPERSPEVRWRRFGAWVGGHLVVAPIVLLVYGFASVDLALRHATGGFVSLGLDGVRVTHRNYVRDDRTVDLVGMIHLGDRAAYEQIFAPFPVDGTLVLEEGVRDESGLLPGGPVYQRVAERLGVEMQRPVEELSTLATRNADIDVSEFDEETLKFLRKVFAIYAAEDTTAALLDYVIYIRGQPDQDELLRAVMQDILERRNAHLLGELDEALLAHERVVVPWGAYHLPDIEREILGRGFVRSDERTVTLIPFAAIGD